MLLDIELKEVNIGDDIIFCDNQGINKGKVLRITARTIKLAVYRIHIVNTDSLSDTVHFLRLSGNNGRYIYKI